MSSWTQVVGKAWPTFHTKFLLFPGLILLQKRTWKIHLPKNCKADFFPTQTLQLVHCILIEHAWDAEYNIFIVRFFLYIHMTVGCMLTSTRIWFGKKYTRQQMHQLSRSFQFLHCWMDPSAPNLKRSYNIGSTLKDNCRRPFWWQEYNFFTSDHTIFSFFLQSVYVYYIVFVC